MESGIKKLCELLKAARHAVVLTGAGVSTESGLPDFRSPQGLWRQMNPATVASIDSFLRDPAEFYRFYRYRVSVMASAKPNPAHYAIAELERLGYIKCVITQNIDGLHRAAGSKRVLEVHGNITQAECVECRSGYPIEVIAQLDDAAINEGKFPRCARCKGLIKPKVVLFGEALPDREFSEAILETDQCDLFLAIGSSLQVFPVNMLPRQAISHGARLAIINLEETQYDRVADVVIHEKVGTVLPQVVACLAC